MAAESIRVEVAYAKPERQSVIAVELPAHSCVEQAIAISGILEIFPEIDLTQQKVGIFSTVCPLSHPLQTGDRVEIYRPLAQDPMTARRKRISK